MEFGLPHIVWALWLSGTLLQASFPYNSWIFHACKNQYCGADICKFCSYRCLAPLYHSCTSLYAPCRYISYFFIAVNKYLTWSIVRKGRIYFDLCLWCGRHGRPAHHISARSRKQRATGSWVQKSQGLLSSDPFPPPRLYLVKVLQPSQSLPSAVDSVFTYEEHFLSNHNSKRTWENSFLDRFPVRNPFNLTCSWIFFQINLWFYKWTWHGLGLALKVLFLMLQGRMWGFFSIVLI